MGRLHGVAQGIRRANGLRHAGEIRVACLDGLADQIALGRCALFHDPDQRKRRFAFTQIVAHVLAQCFGVATVIEHVVDQLKRGADMAAVGARGLFLLGCAARQHGPDARGSFEQLGCLVADDLQIPFF